MNTALLDQMGFGGLDFSYVIIAVLVLLVLLLISFICLIIQNKKIKNLQKRLDRFTSGKNGKSLEDDFVTLFEDNITLKNQVEANRKDIRSLYKKSELAFQKMGLVKYDAFNQMGGKLSFCLALLDDNNNGFVLNSVHSTEGCYSYTKRIKAGECALSLGKEEEKAVELAMEKK